MLRIRGGTVVTMDARRRVLEGATLEVEGATIASLGAPTMLPPRRSTLAGSS